MSINRRAEALKGEYTSFEDFRNLEGEKELRLEEGMKELAGRIGANEDADRGSVQKEIQHLREQVQNLSSEQSRNRLARYLHDLENGIASRRGKKNAD